MLRIRWYGIRADGNLVVARAIPMADGDLARRDSRGDAASGEHLPPVSKPRDT